MRDLNPFWTGDGQTTGGLIETQFLHGSDLRRQMGYFRDFVQIKRAKVSRSKPELTMTELPSDNELEAIRLLLNNRPEEDFEGLTPAEMHDLIYSSFGSTSPLKINPIISDDVLNQLPFFRLTEVFMNIIQREQKIKLTPLGALPKKILTELYSHRFILEDGVESGIHKLTREIDSNVLSMVHYNTLFSGLIKKHYNRLSLTKTGESLLHPDKRNQLLHKVLESYTEKLPWSNLDGYPKVPVGNLGWGFVIILLMKYGGELREKKFYADKYVRAFPDLLQQFPSTSFASPLQNLIRCFCLRTFDRFLEWWGFVTVEKRNSGIDSELMKISVSPALAEVFQTELY